MPLHQNERVPRCYVLDEGQQHFVQQHAAPKHTPSLRLRSTDSCVSVPFYFQFQALGPNLFRTIFSSDTHPIPPYPSAARPDPARLHGAVEVAMDLGRKRTVIRTDSGVEAVVEWSDAPVVSLFLPGMHKPIYRDLHFRSYAVDGTGVAHYTQWNKDTLHVGLGEKAAPMNLSGRGFLIAASDTYGYDVYHTDPLYKHMPFLINATPQGCVAIFSSSHARSSWSVGSEVDGMWGRYKGHRQAHGGLEEYLLVGRSVEEVVRTYAELVGFPRRVPRFMLGYIGGGMKYSMQDAPRACDAIVGFLAQCEEHDIPVSAFQMSSGYTVAEREPKTRNFFTWNRHRFPNPRAFTKECHRRGVRLLANVKPYVLASHPEYKKLSDAGAFFTDPVTKTAAVARLWSAGGGESGEGSHIDFTSNAGFDWWYEGCKTLKKMGIDAMWNDNNEFNIPSDEWQCALETVPLPPGETRRSIGYWGRAMHTELMAKSSYDACIDAAPDERALVLTRSATAGTMRYASCSWGGDNVTSWEGMKGGNALALNAGFSLLPIYGHDIGGFEGPQPTAEHLVRWVQLGIHSPRFAINCYKTSPDDNLVGEVIEPLIYPAVTPIIRAAIKRRYELVPYTYSLALTATRTAVPPQRWTGWGYETDPEVWTDALTAGDTQYWFGDSLLVAGVYEPEKSHTTVYLPRKSGNSASDQKRRDFGYLNTNAPFQHLASGYWHGISAPWSSSIPVLARCGSAVPVGKNLPTTCRGDEDVEFPGMARDDWRGVEIFPPPATLLMGADDIKGKENKANNGPGMGASPPSRTYTFESSWLEDDGISCEEKADVCLVRVVYEVRGRVDARGYGEIGVTVEATKEGVWEPLWLRGGVDVILPVREERPVRAAGSGKAADKGRDAKGRRRWHVDVVVTGAS